MKLDTPRIQPLQDEQWDDATRAILRPMIERGSVDNVFRTLVNHPDLMRRWLVFANHILFKSTIPARERELLILRIGWLCQAEYEWGQHVRIARNSGLTDEEIHRIKAGPDAPGWDARDRLLLQATDELHADAHMSDAAWQGLNAYYNTQQLMDIVFTVGQYNLVSMALNTFGVQLDNGLPSFETT